MRVNTGDVLRAEVDLRSVVGNQAEHRRLVEGWSFEQRWEPEEVEERSARAF